MQLFSINSDTVYCLNMGFLYTIKIKNDCLWSTINAHNFRIVFKICVQKDGMIRGVIRRQNVLPLTMTYNVFLNLKRHS